MSNPAPLLQRVDLFSMPVWRSRLPEFEPHAEAMRTWITSQWKQGAFKRHANGYGYQTAPILFTPAMLSRQPPLKILRDAFARRVAEILKQRTNHFVHLRAESYAFMAWVLIQTHEEWVSGTWHDHAPALISGCYYLQVPDVDGELEGTLAFMRPAPADGFVRQVQYLRPEQGDFILFPSAMTHRPQPTPSADDIRISVNMDAYVHWAHWDEVGKSIDQRDYRERLLASLDPDAEPPLIPDSGRS